MAKLTYDEVEEAMMEQGYKLISLDYEGCYKPLEIKCPKGHKYEASWSNFKLGKRCPICAEENKFHTIEYIKKEISKNKNILLNNTYSGYNDVLSIVCKCGNIYQKTWTQYQQGKRCNVCTNMAKQEKLFRDRYEDGEIATKTFTSWMDYNLSVRRLSDRNYELFKERINPKELNRALTEYHIDHILSISEGYKKNISIEEIAHPANLQLIHWSENLKKGKKSEQTYKELKKRIKMWSM